MPQVPLGQFTLIKSTITDALFEYLAARPYAEVAGFCQAIQVAPVFTVEDDQDIGLIPRVQEQVEIPPETPPEGETDEGTLAIVPDEEPEPEVAGDAETETGLPPMMKGMTT